MTEYAYDPEFPYVAVGASSGMAHARFRTLPDAESFAVGFCEVIDTTPKPKIPEDAQFIYWRDNDNQPYFARKDETLNLWETDEGCMYAEGSLLLDIGDAEVTVLVPKESE